MAHDLKPYLTTDAEPRTPGGGLVATCAALGSPVTEQARVVEAECVELRAAVWHGAGLEAWTVELLARWVSCLWWRTLWRLGHPAGNDRAEVEAVATMAITLPWLPDDWAADLARSVLFAESMTRQASVYAREGEANGRAKLSRAEVEAIREERAGGASWRDLASRWGCSHTRIGQIVRGDGWIE